HDLFDLLNSRNILLWGKNVVVSSPHTVPVLKEAAKRGARLLLIDPVWHKTARLCDAFVQPRPGSDFALAMATARLLFERTWTDRRDSFVRRRFWWPGRLQGLLGRIRSAPPCTG